MVPVLHIADATAEVFVNDGIKKIGLLGTKFTMEHDFYNGRLSKKYDLDVIVPNPEVGDIIIITNQLRKHCRKNGK